jgi:drug/metabolite transporter (DMT)-like permease
MNKKHFALLVLLAAIWGASFMFMRILAPVLGPVLTASFRLLVGGLFLLIYFKLTKTKVVLKPHIKYFFLLGLISFATPYFLFSLAALYIPSGVSAILNSTSPMFSMLLSVIIFKERFNYTKLLGLLLGTIGVVIISVNAVSLDSSSYILGILACLGAAFLYSVSGALIQRIATHIDSKALAVGNQLAAGVILLPLVYFYPITGEVNLEVIANLIVFGILGSGIASLIYFYLMKEIGPLKTLSVTYLLPVFGLFWGYVILNEPLKTSFIIGLAFITVCLILLSKKKKEITS